MLPISALWPVNATTSMFISFMLMGMMPAVWAVSTTKVTPCSRQILPISLIGCTVPITFEPWLTITSLVFGRIARAISSGSTNPALSKGTKVASRAMIADHVIDRPDHGIVFEVGGDDVIAGRNQPRNDEIQRIGHVVAEDQPVRGILVAAKELRQALAQTVQQ